MLLSPGCDSLGEKLHSSRGCAYSWFLNNWENYVEMLSRDFKFGLLTSQLSISRIEVNWSSVTLRSAFSIAWIKLIILPAFHLTSWNWCVTSLATTKAPNFRLNFLIFGMKAFKIPRLISNVSWSWKKIEHCNVSISFQNGAVFKLVS